MKDKATKREKVDNFFCILHFFFKHFLAFHSAYCINILQKQNFVFMSEKTILKVKWGDKGCTEGALHLEKTKDSQEVGYIAKEVEISDNESDPPIERRSRSATVTSIKMCCCGLFKRNVRQHKP